MHRKLLACFLAALLVFTALPVFAEDSVSFTDSAGRAVDVPAEITRIAPSGQLSQIMLLAIAPESLVGIATPWTDTAKAYLGTYAGLPVIGQLYGSRDLNLEELAVLDPQIIIDLGEAKGSIQQDMDDLQAQVGIPSVHIDAYMESYGDSYRMLGKLLGKAARGEALGNYCDEIYVRTHIIMQAVGDARVNFLYVLGEDGLSVLAKGSYHAQLLDMLANNVAEVEDPSSKGSGDPVDMEQLLLWNPDVIVFAPGSGYAQVADDPLWQALDAVADGQYVEVPFGPFNWMGSPPSVQRYLGILWFCDTFYPQASDYDLYAETARYFDLFYHYDLTQAEFDMLLENASLPAK